jgi:hypothetical protein
MKNKTAMQELIHWLKSGWKDEDVDTVIKKAEQLLEMEKEHKIEFAYKVLQNAECSFNGIPYLEKDIDDIYNETYNVKDN